METAFTVNTMSTVYHNKTNSLIDMIASNNAMVSDVTITYTN